MPKMFSLSARSERFRRGRLAFAHLRQRFGSAAQLPLLIPRKVQLNPPARTKSRFSHLPRIFARAALLILPVVLLVTLLTLRAAHHEGQEQATYSSLATDWQSFLEAASTSAAKRPVFPYSIVPGGVRDANELETAASNDSVVARHYSDFRIARAHTLRLNRPVAMFVSYRRNNQVYWTRNKMVIPGGETLISDGENLARVRCANRLSPVAAKPVAATDPSTEELETPVFVPPLLASLLPGNEIGFFPAGAPDGAVPGLPAVPPGPAGSSGSSGSPGSPVFPPILPPGVSPFTPTTPPTEPPPVVTPEPGTFALLLAGAALVMLFAALALRRNA
jgi:PEP-CTERM motif.